MRFMALPTLLFIPKLTLPEKKYLSQEDTSMVKILFFPLLTISFQIFIHTSFFSFLLQTWSPKSTSCFSVWSVRHWDRKVSNSPDFHTKTGLFLPCGTERMLQKNAFCVIAGVRPATLGGWALRVWNLIELWLCECCTAIHEDRVENCCVLSSVFLSLCVWETEFMFDGVSCKFSLTEFYRLSFSLWMLLDTCWLVCWQSSNNITTNIVNDIPVLQVIIEPSISK